MTIYTTFSKKTIFFLILVFSMLPVIASCTATEKKKSTVDTNALRQWQDMRFGMFIHWGPVSLTGHEIGWSRGRETSIEEYDQLYKRFNPTQFNADEWVRVAKEAGVKYIMLTTKHHDGFCLWDTKQTDYNIMNSPFGRDVVKELVTACRKQGIAFGTYYSTCDWHHPDFPRTSPGGKVIRKQHNLDRYTEYLKAQVKELLTNYGPLVTLWYDVPQEFSPERGQNVIDFTRSLQPDIIINNRTGAKGDFDTPEQRIGGFNIERPWETCMTICTQWAWKPNDKMKSLKQCLQTLIRTAGGDGNLLFNVGPMPDGRIEPRQVERLKEMGQWLKSYGETIYGTRGGPFKPGQWGASTRKGNNIYLHILDFTEDKIELGPLSKKIVSTSVLTGGKAKVTQTDKNIIVAVPESDRKDIDTLIKLTLDGSAMDIKPVGPLPSGSIALGKKATASNVIQKNYAPDKAFDDDPDTRWATKAGTKQAWIEVDLGKRTAVSSAMIDERTWDRVKKFQLQYKEHNKWKTIIEGTTIGEKKELEFNPVTARIFRLNILDATEGPTIWEIQLYRPE